MGVVGKVGRGLRGHKTTGFRWTSEEVGQPFTGTRDRPDLHWRMTSQWDGTQTEGSVRPETPTGDPFVTGGEVERRTSVPDLRLTGTRSTESGHWNPCDSGNTFRLNHSSY